MTRYLIGAFLGCCGVVVPEFTTMADPTGRVARSGSPLSMPRRSGRVVRASSKVSTALSALEKVTAEANEINEQNARSKSAESEFQPAPESRKSRSNGETGRSMF